MDIPFHKKDKTARVSMKYNSVATSKDVAMLAGVSQATVSRAFSNSANLAPETRMRVMEAANTLNYKPNALARSLVSTHSNIIGVVKGYTQNVMFSEMLSEIVYGLQQADKRVIYFEARQNESIDNLADKIMQYQIEGLILMYANLTSDLTLSCRQRDIPVLQMHRYSKTLRTNAVLPDNFRAAAEAAELFVKRGFRNFVYLGGEINSSSNMERQLGFLKKLGQYGFNNPVVWNGLYTYESGREAMRTLAPKLPLPCAILCGNDLMAFGAIDVLKYELGLRVGEDVALIGFDNTFMGQWPSYSLTTFAQPIEKMVQDGLSLLFANINDHQMAPVERRYPLVLIERETTGNYKKKEEINEICQRE